jgi:hypothetical protein
LHWFTCFINVCRSWEDLTWDGTGRRPKVNAVLGSLCRFYYHGMVELNGERFAAMQWADWGLKDLSGGCVGRVLGEFTFVYKQFTELLLLLILL